MIFDNLIDIKTGEPVEIEDSPEIDQERLDHWKRVGWERRSVW